MRLTILEATDSNIPDILRLYREAGIGDGVSFGIDEVLAQFAKIKTYPNYKVFVAVLGDVIAGTYELLIMDNLAKRGRPSAVVEDVAVSPNHQGQGIGRAMMEHAIKMSRDAGCYKLALSSNLDRVKAHEFYDSLGFERHGYSFRVALG